MSLDSSQAEDLRELQEQILHARTVTPELIPHWKLRRLIREYDEWHCSLSKQLGLPAELDDMDECNHETLALAVLGAFVEARRRHLTARESRPGAVPLVYPVEGCTICCDNFG